MKPNTILGRYLMKQITLTFLGVIIMALGIIFVFEMIELLRRAASVPQITFWFLLKMAFTKLPEAVNLIFPFVVMIAAMITFWKICKNSEFVIILAAGTSIWEFLAPVLLATFLIGVINITMINPISSKMYEQYERLNVKFKMQDMNTVLYTDKGLWTRESLESGNIMIIQAKFVNQEKSDLLLRSVSVLELDKHSRIIKSTEAFAALLNDKHELNLKDVRIFTTGKTVQKVNNITYHTELTPKRIKETFITPEAISFWNLPGTIKFYERSGFAVLKHHMHYLSLLASPFLLMSMVLIAAVFALRPNQRRGGILYLVVSGIITGFVVYFMTQIIYAFGLNGYLPEIMAVWTPIIITSCLSITILLQMQDG
ncbi:MAG: LptF/LptG family permease [Alphaproteobacteria bacterium]|nr:LptF/LptG family permease [Alphaproteobacteria bacterium]